MSDAAYPRLGGLITLDQLPEQVGFLQSGLSGLLDHVFYRELRITGKPGTTSTRLELVIHDGLGFEIPGTGLEISLRGERQEEQAAIIPINLRYSLGIRRVLPDWRFENFSFTPQAFFELFVSVSKVDDAQLLQMTLLSLFDFDGEVLLDEFASRLNDLHGLSIPIPLDADPRVALGQIQQELQVAALSLREVILNDFIIDPQDVGETLQRLERFLLTLRIDRPLEKLKSLLIPRVRAGLQLGVDVAFPRKMLLPMHEVDDVYVVEDDDDVKTKLVVDVGELVVDSRAGFGFDQKLSASMPPPYDKAQLGNTGLTLSLLDARLDLSRKRNIPEATADGRPDDFVGVYIEKVAIGLPEKWFKRQAGATAEIFGRRLILGTGGISGTIGLEAVNPGTPDPEIAFQLGGGFVIGFRSFDIRFQQNAILESNVRGSLVIPGFKDATGADAKIEVDVHFDTDGDFKITAREADGIAIRLADVVEITIRSLTVGRQDDRFFAAVSGKLSFLDVGGFLEDNLPKDIEIQKLLIWDDGGIELEGGSLNLRDPKTLKIPPVELTITALHLGAHEQIHQGVMRRYKMVGFDGGLSVKPGGVDARGDGFKVYFTVDNGTGRPLHVFVRIESIAIDLIIPGEAKPESAALLLNGYLSVKEPAPDATGSSAGREYAGAVRFTLPRLKMAGSAAMRYNPRLPSFLIDVGLEISNPILLGSTGLGIYGFRGLVGRHFVASREHIGLEADAKWYQYYKKKAPEEYREGIQPGKFAPVEGFSLGAGVSLATASDAGKAFSSKIFFLLSLPEVFLLEGQAQILKERIGLDTTDDPPFYALIAITGRSLEAALGVNYRVPDDGGRPGAIATVDGLLELGFFFGDSVAWYLNLGRESPDTKRIQVTLLSLFNAYYYMMLSSAGIRTGAGASFALKKRFGPVKAEVSAYLDVAARISFEHKQLGGSIQLGGSVGLKIFRFGFTISVAASLAAEAPRPFVVSGSIKVCIRVLRKKRCVGFSFTWTFDRSLDMSEIPVLDVSRAARALNIQTLETFPLFATASDSIPPPGAWGNADDYIVPVDSFIDVEFAKTIDPRGSHPSLARLGGVTHAAKYVELIPPQRGSSPQVKHEFAVEQVEVKCWEPGSPGRWVDYDVYEAATPMAHLPLIDPADLVGLKQGFWQLDDPARYNKLRLLSQTPFSYVTQGTGDLATEELGVTARTLFCEDEKTPPRCVLLADVAGPGAQRVPGERPIYYGGALFRLRGGDGQVLSEDTGDFERALGLSVGQRLEIDFPEPAAELALRLRSIAADVTVRYFRRVAQDDDSASTTVYAFEEILTVTVPAADLAEPVVYDDADEPVDRMSVEAGPCPPDAPASPGFVYRYESPRHTSFSGLIDDGDPSRTVAFGRTGSDGLLSALDPDGGVLWSHRYRAEDAPLNFSHGLAGPGGDLLVSGSVPVGPDRRRHVVVRLTPDGKPVWSFSYGHPDTRFHLGLAAVGDDTFVLTGWNNQRSSVDDLELVRIDDRGQLLRSRRVGGGGDEQVAGILPFAGGVLIFGETSGNGWDGFVAWVTPSLNLRWAKRIGTSRFDTVRAVVPLSSVEFLLAGVTSLAGAPAASSTYLMQFHSDVDEQRAMVFDLFDDVGDRGFNRLFADGDGFHLLAYPNSGPRHARLLALDDASSIRWVKRLELEDQYLLDDLLPAPPGTGLLAAGRCLGAGRPQTGLLAKTDRDFQSCVTARDPVPQTTIVNFQTPDWRPPIGDLLIERQALDLEVGDAPLERATICAPSCGPDRPSTFLHELCYLPLSAAERNRTVVAEADVQADNDAMLRGLRSAVQPVWRPATTFAIHLRTLDRASASGQQTREYRGSFVFGFRTAGPVGHFHEYVTSQGTVDLREDYRQLLDRDREDQYRLASLRPYVDYRRSYPNADGRLTLAKPLFYRRPVLLFFFLQDYVYSMYGDWDAYPQPGSVLEAVSSALEAVILDPLDSTDQPARSEVEPSWRRNNVARTGGDVEIVENLIAQGDPCTAVTPGGERRGVNARFKLPDLLPSKAYTARFDALFGPASATPRRQEVHRYVFQTSRYADFAEQVGSYRLAAEGQPGEDPVEGEAVFEINRPFEPAAIDAARSVLAGTAGDDLVQRFADRFDRLLTGALELGDLHPPQTTEFNVLRRGSRILGILVRSPEPLNDPKLPAGELDRTLRLTAAGGPVFQAVHSKDASQVFLTDRAATLDLPAGTYRFRFKYRLFDGEAYKPKAHAEVEIEVG